MGDQYQYVSLLPYHGDSSDGTHPTNNCVLDSHSYNDSEESGHLMLSNDSMTNVHNDDSASPTAQLSFSCGSDLDFKSSVALVQSTPVGRLTARREVWDRLGASGYVLSVLESGYKLPFISLPDKIILCNNLSARNETEFVSEAIDKLQALVASVVWRTNPRRQSSHREFEKW